MLARRNHHRSMLDPFDAPGRMRESHGAVACVCVFIMAAVAADEQQRKKDEVDSIRQEVYQASMADGIKYIKEGYHLEQVKDLHGALECYEIAVMSFETVLQVESNEWNKVEIESKMEMYNSRIRQIRAHLSSLPAAANMQESPSATPASPLRTPRKEPELRPIPSSTNTRAQWDRLYGLQPTKLCLDDFVVKPMRGTPIHTIHHVLLHGPPNNGKTMLMKGVAKAFPNAFFGISASHLRDKKQANDRILQTIYSMASKASTTLPGNAVVMFFDEIDLLFVNDSAAQGAFLKVTEAIQKSKQQIIIVGATNNPWNIDASVASKFPVKLLIGPPDVDVRKTIVATLLAANKHDHDIDENQSFLLAQMMHNFSPKTIEMCLKVALQTAWEEKSGKANMSHFYSVLEQAQTVDKEKEPYPTRHNKGVSFLYDQTDEKSRHQEWRRSLGESDPIDVGANYTSFRADPESIPAIRAEIKSARDTLRRLTRKPSPGFVARKDEDILRHEDEELEHAMLIAKEVAGGLIQAIEWPKFIGYLHRQAAHYGKKELTSEDILRAREAFDVIDHYGTGIIDRDAFVMGLRFDVNINKLFEVSLARGVVQAESSMDV